MTSLMDRLREQRDRHVLHHAAPHLVEGEEVYRWVRARHPERRWRGYAFLTSHKLLVVWRGHGEPLASDWDDVRAWGVSTEGPDGPRVALETPAGLLEFDLPVGSWGTARKVTACLGELAQSATQARGRPAHGGVAAFEADPDVEIAPRRRSAGAQVKRLIVTVVGLIGIIGGVAISPIPGPWSIPLVLGGLALLASEYDWAEDVLDWVREFYRQARDKLRARQAAREE